MAVEAAHPRPSMIVPVAMLLVLGTMWGFTMSMAKVAGEGGVPPIAYSFWQAAGGAAILLVICRLRGLAIRPSRQVLVYAAVNGLLAAMLPSANLVYVAPHLTAGLIGMVVALVPLIAFALTVAFHIEPFSPRRAVGVLFGFAAMLMLLLPKTGLPSPDMAGWLLVALFTPLCYAASAVFIARFRPAGVHSLVLALGMVTAAAVIAGTAMVATGSVYLPFASFFAGQPLPAADLAILAQMAVTGTAYIMYFEIVRLAGPIVVTQVGYIVTLTGFGWGWLIFAERPGPWIWAAVATVFVGLALVNWPSRRAG